MANDENTHKPGETGFQTAIAAATAAIEWIEQERGSTKDARALRILLKQTRSALERGVEPEPRVADDIMALYFDEYGGRRPKTEASKWLSGKGAIDWWGCYQHAIDDACRQRGIPLSPRLDVALSAGGRGNSNTFAIRFLPLDADEAAHAESAAAPEEHTSPGLVRYRMDPAKPILWFRLLFGSKPFPMRSWRGYGLIGLLGFELLLVALLWGVVFQVLNKPRPVLASDLLLVLFAFGFTALIWKSSRALRALTWSRISIASEFYLAMSELHGQFRTTRLTEKGIKDRHFQVVRHWATCPWCEGEVDLVEGGQAFPDRIIGRCSDSPSEHVFSFDPLTLCGRSLIAPPAGTQSPV